MNPARPHDVDCRLARLYVVVLLAAWIVGTGLVLVANAAAPTTPPAPVTTSYIALLRGTWGWYFAGYTLFFTADTAISLLGAVLVAWLKPTGFRGPAIVALFVVGGMLGVVADVHMLAAAQLLRVGSALLAPDVAGAWLDNLNATCNWLSVASFLPPGVAMWMACAAAQAAGAGRGWIALTRFAAIYQIVVGLLSAAAFLTQQALLIDLALLTAIIGLPIVAAIWLFWMLREMKTQTSRRQHP